MSLTFHGLRSHQTKCSEFNYLQQLQSLHKSRYHSLHTNGVAEKTKHNPTDATNGTIQFYKLVYTTLFSSAPVLISCHIPCLDSIDAIFEINSAVKCTRKYILLSMNYRRHGNLCIPYYRFWCFYIPLIAV